MLTITAPTITRPSGDRSIESEWHLSTEDGEIIAAELTSGHYGTSKQYSSLLRLVRIKHENGFTVRSYMLMSGVRVLSKGTKRYSASALDAFHVQALEALANADDPRVDAIFTGQEVE